MNHPTIMSVAIPQPKHSPLPAQGTPTTKPVQATQATQMTQTPLTIPARKGNLLLVDDDPDLLKLLSIRLKANGYVVSMASTEPLNCMICPAARALVRARSSVAPCSLRYFTSISLAFGS